jgi:hypothetical protein
MSLQTPSLRKAREDDQKHALKAWMTLAVDIGHPETDQIFREVHMTFRPVGPDRDVQSGVRPDLSG